MSESREWFTTGQVAKRLKVAPRTVAKWVDKGLFPGAWKMPGSLDRRIPRSGVISFCEANGMPVPEPLIAKAPVRLAFGLEPREVPAGYALTQAFDMGQALADPGVDVTHALVGDAEGLVLAKRAVGYVRRSFPAARITLAVSDDVAPDAHQGTPYDNWVRRGPCPQPEL